MLMPKRKDACPVDYRMCSQTVTVYHYEDGKITRTECPKAFLDFRKNQTVDKTGSREANSFLLVIPCCLENYYYDPRKDPDNDPMCIVYLRHSNKLISVGDKVMKGVGPKVTPEEWAAFIPAKVPGLVVVKYVDPKYWGDRMVHVEAGG